MKKNSTILMAIFIAIMNMLNSCTTSSTPRSGQQDVKEITFEEATQDFKLSSEFRNIHFVQLEATDKCIVSDITKIIEAEAQLIILTKDNEIFCFKKDNGTFIRQIGNIGEAPEEYLSIGDIYYNENGKSINIIDKLRSSIVTYNINGEYIGRKKIKSPMTWINSAERSDDGYIMMCNMLANGDPSSDYAYTIIKPNEETINIDPFAPVKVESYATNFAARPMAACKDGFTFLKFINDTIFTMSKDEIKPKYKLSMKKKMPQKDVVAQMGEYGEDVLLKMSMNNNYFSGFDKLFETGRYIALIPRFYMQEGYYWIDKESGKGKHIGSSYEFNLEIDMMIQGRNIINIAGCNKNGFISYLLPEHIEVVKKELVEKETLIPFNARLKHFFEKATTEGNPCLIIYEN